MAQVKNLSRPLRRKGAPPPQAKPVVNLEKHPSDAKVPLQVKIPSETRIAFKSHALVHNMDASDLFQVVWNYYREQHG